MRSRSWPFLTVSPSRARISTTRPEASVTTGTVRATSGYTAPVTTNFDGASYCAAVATGYRSGWSTEKWVTSRPGTTVAGGGASAATLSFVPQPDTNRAANAAKTSCGDNLQNFFLRIFTSRTKRNLFAIPIGYTPTVRTDSVVLNCSQLFDRLPTRLRVGPCPNRRAEMDAMERSDLF